MSQSTSVGRLLAGEHDRSSFRRKWILAIPALFIVIPLASYWYWAKIEHRFIAVSPGKVYRSAAMPAEALLAAVSEHGIRTVIDLRRPRAEVHQERELLEAAGVRHINIPSRITPSSEVIDAVIATMSNPDNQPVLIHCKHGIGRSVLLSALYKIDAEDWPNEAARRSAYWRSGMGSFESDSRRGKLILNYVPRHRQNAKTPAG